MTICKLPALAAGALFCVLIAFPGSTAGAEADDLALPVRKGASSKSGKKEPEKTQSSATTEKKSTSGSSKSTASSKSETTKKSEPSSSKSSVSKSSSASKSSSSKSTAASNTSTSSKSEKTATASKSASRKSSDDDSDKKPKSTASSKKTDEEKPKTTRTAARDTDRESEDGEGESSRSEDRKETAGSSSGEIDLPEPQIINATPPPSQRAALPPPPPVTQQGGFLRRLFGGRRNQQQQSQAASPTPWNTDYATRAATTLVPAMLTGVGWGGVDLPIGEEDQYRLNTLPSEFRPTDLMLIPKEWCFYGNPMYLRREAAQSLLRMFNDAARQGLTLRLVSGYRDYGHQLRLYNQSVARRGPNQKMVARPGRSEHQLGTTADLTNSKTHLLKRSFIDTPEGQWLVANAARYGWKMTVMRGDGPRSHADEPWHLRYLGSHVNDGPRTVVQQSGQSPTQAPRRSLLGRLGQMFKRN